MNSIKSRFDRTSKKLTLNSALTTLTLISVCFGMWIPQTLKYSKNGDTGGFYLGVVSIILMGTVVLISWARVHAVVRRLVSQAGQTANGSPSEVKI
jgi:hypothetical protein